MNLNAFLNQTVFNGFNADPLVPNQDWFCVGDKADREYSWSDLATVIAVMFGLLAACVVVGTVLDLCQVIFDAEEASATNRGRQSLGLKMMLSFSLYSNAKAIMATSSAGGQDTLACINGIRTISIMWVMLGHSFFFYTSLTIANPSVIKDVIEGKQGVAFEAVINAMPSVDTFFLMR